MPVKKRQTPIFSSNILLEGFLPNYLFNFKHGFNIIEVKDQCITQFQSGIKYKMHGHINEAGFFDKLKS